MKAWERVSYDETLRKARMEDGTGRWIEIVYREDGQWVSTQRSDGSWKKLHYTAMGDLTGFDDGLGQWEVVVRTHSLSIYFCARYHLYRVYDAVAWRHSNTYPDPFIGDYDTLLAHLKSNRVPQCATAYQACCKHHEKVQARMKVIKVAAKAQPTWWQRVQTFMSELCR